MALNETGNESTILRKRLPRRHVISAPKDVPFPRSDPLAVGIIIRLKICLTSDNYHYQMSGPYLCGIIKPLSQISQRALTKTDTPPEKDRHVALCAEKGENRHGGPSLTCCYDKPAFNEIVPDGIVHSGTDRLEERALNTHLMIQEPSIECLRERE